MQPDSNHRRYDACLIAVADLRTDARTLNIARALRCQGKEVCLIAPDWSEGALVGDMDVYYVPCRRSGRLWRKWLEFTRRAKEQCRHIIAASFWAEDLYALPVAATLAKAQRAKLLYDSREIYSALGPLHKHPIKQAILAAIERHYASSAHRIIVSGEMDAEYIRQHLRRNEKPDVVMNVPPYAEVGQNNRLREYFHIPPEKPVVIYQGVLLQGRGIEPMIAALAFAPDVHFCILGDGPSRREFEKLATTSGMAEQVHFRGTIPYSELLEWTASADAGICFVEPISFSYSLALPNKLFEYAMARIPALVSDLPAMRRVIELHPFGELVAVNATPEHIALTLYKLLRNKAAYTSSADTAARIFNREAQEKTIAEIWKELVG